MCNLLLYYIRVFKFTIEVMHSHTVIPMKYNRLFLDVTLSIFETELLKYF